MSYYPKIGEWAQFFINEDEQKLVEEKENSIVEQIKYDAVYQFMRNVVSEFKDKFINADDIERVKIIREFFPPFNQKVVTNNVLIKLINSAMKDEGLL